MFCKSQAGLKAIDERLKTAGSVSADAIAREIQRDLIDSTSNESGRDCLIRKESWARRPQLECRWADWPQHVDRCVACQHFSQFLEGWLR